MKKLRLFLALLFIGSCVSLVSAQIAYDYDDYKKNRFAIDLGVGSSKGYGSWDVGLRYQHNFAPFIGWDVISAKVTWPIENAFEDYPFAQIMTGLKGYTPRFYRNMSGYVGLSAGYGLRADAGCYERGACLEFGFGLNLCKNVYIGYALNFQQVKDTRYDVTSKGKVHMFRMGFEF